MHHTHTHTLTALQSELAILRRKSADEFWFEDLKYLEQVLDEMNNGLEALRMEQEKKRVKAGGKKRVAPKINVYGMFYTVCRVD